MEKVATAAAQAAIGPYSQAITANGFVFTSGQSPLDPATGVVVEGGITEQAAGADLTTVAKTTCFLADMGDFAAFNEVYAGYFTGNPARSCVAVKDLPKGVLCEVEAVAIVKS